MQTVQQFSVQLINKPGRLASILSALNKEKVAIRAFTVMDSGNRGTLRFVADDATLAASALETLNLTADTSDVLLVEVSAHTGGLPKLCQRLSVEHLNVDYAYGAASSPTGTKGSSFAIIKVNDLSKAQRVLGAVNGGRSKKRPGRRPTFAR